MNKYTHPALVLCFFAVCPLPIYTTSEIKFFHFWDNTVWLAVFFYPNLLLQMGIFFIYAFLIYDHLFRNAIRA